MIERDLRGDSNLGEGHAMSEIIIDDRIPFQLTANTVTESIASRSLQVAIVRNDIILNLARN